MKPRFDDWRNRRSSICGIDDCSHSDDDVAEGRPMSGAGVAAVPDDIDSPAGKLVYLALAEGGSADVDDLRHRLGVPRTTLLGVLDALNSRGLVERIEAGRFAVA
ncbi:MAG: helix-turn-helix domain-containing protein [Halobacteriales archaeon]